jgi:hypothetical protein
MMAHHAHSQFVKMKEDGTMTEGKLLATIHRISECAAERKSSVVIYTDECKLLIDYIHCGKEPPKRVVQPADVADRIVQMLDQTVTDQDALISRLLDIIQLLAKRDR